MAETWKAENEMKQKKVKKEEGSMSSQRHTWGAPNKTRGFLMVVGAEEKGREGETLCKQHNRRIMVVAVVVVAVEGKEPHHL